MKVGDLIRHIDDPRDQFYVVIEILAIGCFKIKHAHDGREHWRSKAAYWEVIN